LRFGHLDYPLTVADLSSEFGARSDWLEIDRRLEAHATQASSDVTHAPACTVFAGVSF
jgi:hypothetical protein